MRGPPAAATAAAGRSHPVCRSAIPRAGALRRSGRGAMGRLGHPDDTDSSEEHGAAHEASRQAGPAAGTCGTEREREGEDGSALRRSRQALSDPSSSPAFAEVWRATRELATKRARCRAASAGGGGEAAWKAALMLCRHPGNGGRAGALPASGRMLSAFNAFLSPGGTVLRLAGACAIMEERMDEIAN